jgi:hypothetical protein
MVPTVVTVSSSAMNKQLHVSLCCVLASSDVLRCHHVHSWSSSNTPDSATLPTYWPLLHRRCALCSWQRSVLSGPLMSTLTGSVFSTIAVDLMVITTHAAIIS